MACVSHQLSANVIQLVVGKWKEVVYLSFPDQAKELWVPLEAHMEVVKLVLLLWGEGRVPIEQGAELSSERPAPFLLPPLFSCH